ncbi:MAG: phenylacetate-CoA oxygenase subunit PaaC [Chitinophagales bacterium]|nr:phenylacetate-CoA oxygenase subunit PaaC [Chitinophagales bacterium]
MQALRNLLLKTADDALILGHRNSEWTGLGPILEEDIAFSSMAQDKIGHALALYTILHDQLGEPEPDHLAFRRPEKEFYCCHMVELPIGEYDFTTIRHFLFDHAELLRYDLFSNSAYGPLSALARKIKGELKYHVLHADSWVMRLSRGTDESYNRLQSALNNTYSLALGMFEIPDNEQELINDKIFSGENKLKSLWEEKVGDLAKKAGLEIPVVENKMAGFGGRKGHHTEFLHGILEEMTQVFKLEEKVEW